MIRIQEHLNRPDVENYLDSLAEELWSNLNPILANGKDLKKNSLIGRCKKYKNYLDSNEYLLDYANNDLATLNRHKLFFDFLLNNNYLELKRLITARPNQFSGIMVNIFNILNHNDIYTGTPGNYSQTKFGELLSETIFNYKAFRKSDYCKDLFNKIGFSLATCPYCNDNNVTIVKLKSNSSELTKNKAYLDIDHFYSKSMHPFFATTFFNLIPSCHDCNSGDKGDKVFTIETHIHPYCESFDDFYKFNISLGFILGSTDNNLKIEKNHLKPLDKTLTDLNLVARFNNHIPQIQNLVNFFNNYKHHIGTENEDFFIDAIFKLNGGIPREKIGILKNQRGKMSRDVLKQIDIYNILNIT